MNFLKNDNLKKQIRTFDRIMIAGNLFRFIFLLLFAFLLFDIFFLEMNPILWVIICFAVVLVIFITLTHLFSGILVEKSNVERLETIWKQWLNFLYYIPLFPISFPVHLLFNLINKVSGTSSIRFNIDISEDELKNLIEKESELELEEREMITSIFEFSDTKVSEIMIPRIDIKAVDESDGLDKLLGIIVNQGFSRIPVYRGSIDEIVGIVYAKDVLQSYFVNKKLPTLTEVIREKVYFVPESARIDDLLKTFRDEKIQIAVALDEYGGTAGLVTLEDIVEEIFGEIEDEYDKKKNRIERLKDGVIVISAQVEIEKVFKILDKEIPNLEGVETIGGYLLDYLGRIPDIGEKVQIENLKFEIMDADERKIKKIKIFTKGK